MNIKEILGINPNRKWGNGITGRSSFIESFLLESPENSPFESWPGVQDIIEDAIREFPNNLAKLENNIYNIETIEQQYCWVEKNAKIILGVVLEKRPYTRVVRMVGKDPAFDHQPPYASDLYLTILKHGGKKICLMSDKSLSEDGYSIWKRLFQAGHKVLLYDKNKPGGFYIRFKSIGEMDKFFQKGKKYQDYQYVLTESSMELHEVYSQFYMRQLREDFNLGLED